MAEEKQEEAPKKGGNGLIIVLMVIMILLIVGIGAMAFLLLSGDKSDSKEEAKEEQHASAEHGSEGNSDADGIVRSFSPNFKQYDPPEPGAAPQYFAMEPFVVNFKGEGQARFLAVTLKFMTYYPQLVTDMEDYRPMLRNDITSLLRIQKYSEMSLDDGPDVLRQKILEKARAVIEKRGIYPDILEDVFFERFVMQ